MLIGKIEFACTAEQEVFEMRRAGGSRPIQAQSHRKGRICVLTAAIRFRQFRQPLASLSTAIVSSGCRT